MMSSHRNHHHSNRKILQFTLFIVLLIICLLFLLGLMRKGIEKSSPSSAAISSPSSPTSSSPQETISPSSPNDETSPTPTDTAAPSPLVLECLDQKELQDLIGKNMILIRDNELTEISALECRYESPDLIKGEHPTLSYTVYAADLATLWQNRLDQVQAKPGFQKIENNDQEFVYINPVKELSQGSFYGKNDHVFVELTYTSINEDHGSILEKIQKAGEKILATYQ